MRGFHVAMCLALACTGCRKSTSTNATPPPDAGPVPGWVSETQLAKIDVPCLPKADPRTGLWVGLTQKGVVFGNDGAVVLPLPALEQATQDKKSRPRDLHLAPLSDAARAANRGSGGNDSAAGAISAAHSGGLVRELGHSRRAPCNAWLVVDPSIPAASFGVLMELLFTLGACDVHLVFRSHEDTLCSMPVDTSGGASPRPTAPFVPGLVVSLLPAGLALQGEWLPVLRLGGEFLSARVRAGSCSGLADGSADAELWLRACAVVPIGPGCVPDTGGLTLPKRADGLPWSELDRCARQTTAWLAEQIPPSNRAPEGATPRVELKASIDTPYESVLRAAWTLGGGGSPAFASVSLGILRQPSPVDAPGANE